MTGSMLDLVQYVDQTYCINLDTRTDRWAEVYQRFERVGIDTYVKRISAVVDNDPRLGCATSHKNIVKDAINKGYQNILIFEDDVLFLHESEPNFHEIISFLKANQKWELFYLGGSPMYPAMYKKGSIFKCRFYHTHAYIIHKRAYEKVLHSGLPIDVWFSLNLASYGFSPLYAVQGPGRSDIQNRDLYNLKHSMLRRYDKLVNPFVIRRWWNYFYLHYLYKFF